MPTTGRIYNCARCHCQVVICQDCDRGNIYCNSHCASIARQQGLKEANIRYKKKPHAKRLHAAAQSRYRQRLVKKVMDQGSEDLGKNALLDSNKKPAVNVKEERAPGTLCCHFCNKALERGLRNTFLRRRQK